MVSSRTTGGGGGAGEGEGGRKWVALVALLALVVVVGQVVQIPRALDGTKLFSADGAERFFQLNAVGMAIAALVALLAPARWRWAVALAALLPLAGVVAVCVAGVPERGWSLVVGLLTLSACWEVGERTLRALGAPQLARLAPVAWLAGTSVVTSVLLVVGRAGLFSWWACGIPLLLVGALGAVRLVRIAAGHRRAIAEAVTGTTLATVCFTLTALNLAWVAVYAFAPEMGFDAMSAKAWMPQYWAELGSLEPIRTHPFFAVTGAAQILAVPGHVLGADEVGRWMQYGSGLAIAATVWWWGSRFGALGPLAAFALVVTPTYIFQAATAYDDLLLTLAAVALALAVYRSVEDRAPGVARPVATGVALGVLGGGMLILKLHLVYVTIGLLLGWVVAGGPRSAVARRLGGVLVGGAAASALTFGLRIVDWQNPVFPSYNNVFKSKWWPEVNETFNFPFWPQAPGHGIVTWPWEALQAGNVMSDTSPPGVMGLLLVATVGAVLLALPALRRPSVRVVWLAFGFAVLLWYVQLRYLRYFTPLAVVGMLLVLAVLRVPALRRWPERALVVGVAAMAISVFPSQMAQFTSTPEHKPPLAAARGSWAEESFLRTVWPERDAFAAVQRFTPERTVILSGNYQRLWLEDARDMVQLGDLLIQPDREPLGEGPEALREWLAGFGIEWLLFSRGPGFEPDERVRELIDAKGELWWADRNWEVWRVAENPRQPVRDPECDPTLVVGSCWNGPALDDKPGIDDTEAGQGVTTTRVTCPGQTVTAEVTVPEGAPAARVQIDGQTELALGTGRSGADVPPGTTRLVGTTMGPGTTLVNIIIYPNPGGRVSRAVVGRIGEC